MKNNELLFTVFELGLRPTALIAVVAAITNGQLLQIYYWISFVLLLPLFEFHVGIMKA